MALQFPAEINQPTPTEAQQRIVLTDSAIVRHLFDQLSDEWADLIKYRNYYDGDQTLVYGSEKFKEFFPNFEGFEDNWCAIVVDALSDKLKLIGLRLDDDDNMESTSDVAPDTNSEADELARKIWNVFRDNDIDEQQNDLTDGVFVEGRAAVIVWKDEELGARIDWQPANLVKVRYSEDDYKKIDFAIKRWETPSGRVRINVYDDKEVRKYVESQSIKKVSNEKPGVSATIPNQAPTSAGLTPYIQNNEPWPLPHDFGEVPVVEFPNKRGSELSDVIPLQDAINYLLTAVFVAADFDAIRQRIFLTHLKAPEGGWDNSPGRIWHLPPHVDADGKVTHGQVEEFTAANLGQYREITEMVLQHLALTSKTPVRMFFKSDRGGRGDAPSGESQLIEDEPLLDKAADRQTRLGNRWFHVAKLVAKAIGVDSRIRGEVVWEDFRSKYRSALIEEAIKLASPEQGLGLPIMWVVERLGLSPEELSELKKVLQEQLDKAEEMAQKEFEAANRPPEPNDDDGSDSDSNSDPSSNSDSDD